MFSRITRCSRVLATSASERVVGACIAAGLVGGEGFAVDASLIKADANKQRSIFPGFEASSHRIIR
jgi:transposase